MLVERGRWTRPRRRACGARGARGGDELALPRGAVGAPAARRADRGEEFGRVCAPEESRASLGVSVVAIGLIERRAATQEEPAPVGVTVGGSVVERGLPASVVGTNSRARFEQKERYGALSWKTSDVQWRHMHTGIANVDVGAAVEEPSGGCAPPLSRCVIQERMSIWLILDAQRAVAVVIHPTERVKTATRGMTALHLIEKRALAGVHLEGLDLRRGLR